VPTALCTFGSTNVAQCEKISDVMHLNVKHQWNGTLAAKTVLRS